jgi:hypothetical protein
MWIERVMNPDLRYGACQIYGIIESFAATDYYKAKQEHGECNIHKLQIENNSEIPCQETTNFILQ